MRLLWDKAWLHRRMCQRGWPCSALQVDRNQVVLIKDAIRSRASQVLAIWSIFTFLLFICTLGLNLALATLFFLLTVTFALLSAGVTHATTNKVGGAQANFVTTLKMH